MGLQSGFECTGWLNVFCHSYGSYCAKCIVFESEKRSCLDVEYT